MKIAILNYNGNAGKTTIATYLLKPRMPDNTPYFSIESINQGASDLGVNAAEQLKGNQFGQVFENLMIEDNAIVDVGASNIESFLAKWTEYEDASELFDLFIVPVTPNQKSVIETINIVDVLSRMRIPARKILIVPNMIEEDPLEEIPQIYAYVKKEKKAWLDEDCMLYRSDIFTFLAGEKLSFEQLLAEEDLKERARQATNLEERKSLARLYRWQSMAKAFNRKLDAAYSVLEERL
ncbi:StbB family protein [Entomobacter blattae]|uniref:Plasmid stability protein StbB n=1 Tax=Entomobacter blattae TaxID=2762277 RepID=A0A7H1NP69_9PROT|nr:StbB family protein [Entomobacter blattae]QNT77579.1 hypothetical protein JGUZn3_03220 [Entomobacter blattae]QNT78432.1 hypothetical protein JGUZn3_12060 [Entomobacter blattae]